jgi:hypothetical protein
LGALAQGLSALSARLEPKQAAEVAATLTQAISRNPFLPVMQALSAVAARLEPKQAAEVAATLTQAVSKTTDPYAMKSLAQGLSAVAARLEPKEAARVYGQAAAILTQAMSKTKDPNALGYLAQDLSAVSARLEPKEAARVCGQAAATLTQAMSKTVAEYPSFENTYLQSLAQGLSAVSARLEPKEAAELAATLIQTMSKLRVRNHMPYLAQGLSAVLSGELPPQTLVDLLKHPLCVGEARRVVLDALARHYHRPFADQWDFVDYVQQQKLALDLTTPPSRSRMLP